jgi:hypothetical protein
MKKGNTVRLMQQVVEGDIVSTRYNEETEGLEHLVEWQDNQNDTHQRWFAEVELEEVQS